MKQGIRQLRSKFPPVSTVCVSNNCNTTCTAFLPSGIKHRNLEDLCSHIPTAGVMKTRSFTFISVYTYMTCTMQQGELCFLALLVRDFKFLWEENLCDCRILRFYSDNSIDYCLMDYDAEVDFNSFCPQCRACIMYLFGFMVTVHQ